MKARVFALVLALVTVGTVAMAYAAAYPSGMISYWRLNEGTGTVAQDSVGTNHGTVNDADWSVSCVSGPCIQSSPRGRTYVMVPNSPSLNVTGDQLTVEAWVYPFASSYQGGQGNCGFVAMTESYGLCIGGWWRGAFQFVVTTQNGWASATSPEDFPGGDWYHMVGVYDGTQLRLYVNGVLDSTAAQHGNIAPFTSPLWIGKYCGGGSGIDWCLYGKIDEVAVYDRVLSEAEILRHYQNGLAGAGYEAYNWTGFFPPVNNLPAFNVAKAGSAIPVKFSLDGNQGLDIFAATYPKVTAIACPNSAIFDAVDQTVTASGNSLSYDPATDQYNFVWKTNKAWAGTCRQLVVRLVDGTDHPANFKFK